MPRLAAALLLSLASAAFAAGEPEFNLVIENHKFAPDRLEVPAGKKVKLLVENKDATPEEFESGQLKIEKVIPGKTKGTIFVGPLKPGEYPFAGEFNEKTAHGVIVAK
ncbi:MAG: cupredoxin domain-containing protein [Usitatibacter sp.]